MRGLQLFGGDSKKSDETEISLLDHEESSSIPIGPHLLKLPDKLLERILENLDLPTYLSLIRVNKQLYQLICEKFLFKYVVLTNKTALLKFNALIECKTLTLRKDISYLVKTVEFVNPEYHDSLFKYSKYYSTGFADTVIGGSYAFSERQGRSDDIRASSRSASVSSTRSKTKQDSSATHSQLSKLESNFSNYTYIELMLNIIDSLPNASHIILSQVEQHFKIPLWYSVLNDGSKDFFKKIIKGQGSMTVEDLRSFRVSNNWIREYENTFQSLSRFKKLSIKAKTKLVLRPNLLCCFGVFDELMLENITITTESIDTPLEYLPLYMRIGRDKCLDLHLPIQALTLKSCVIQAGNGLMRLMYSYFFRVRKLSLFNLQSKYDLLLINCFGSLTHLTIDCNSKCFIDVKPTDESYYFPVEPVQDDMDDLKTLIEPRRSTKLTAPPPTTPVVVVLNNNELVNAEASVPRKPALLTIEQAFYFKSSCISPFHSYFHHFKKLWERIPKSGVHLTIVNIPFTNVFPLIPELVWERFLTGDQDTLCDDSDDDQDIEEYWWDAKIKEYLELTTRHSTGIDDSDEEFSSKKWNDYNRINSFKDIPNVNVCEG
ncbi:unnamed protein product [Kluyveromyces dobzhanskii CBS 2104]|uniref:WGS project CCBQ000000000 data, contig 00017 n=1 Tax=Kluyveromyces dobzhanskii CBS 2104 TaxID=1427455 RepID=A0A0A8L8K2_9SACH|nr:unnamed protein product [Kluyveromyces dobzhanskii CBS 2104]